MLRLRTARELGSRWGAVAALIAAFSSGCVVSPQPSPPMEPVLDAGAVALLDEVHILNTEVSFEGAPGAVDPAEGLVVVTNLDSADAPRLAEVRADGGFRVSLFGLPGHSFRFQVKQSERRSQPVDLTIGAGAESTASTPTALRCVALEPAAWLQFDGGAGEASVVIRNACDEEVAIAAPRLRRGRASFSVSPAAPLALPAGESAVLRVRAGDGGDEREDVLLLDITEPVITRRALTLTRPD